MRNVEIKAKLGDPASILALVRAMDDIREDTTLSQDDVFFHSTNGRLKLRRQGNNAKLIYYDRVDVKGPKLCDYTMTNITEPDSLLKILCCSNGLRGRVKKIRHLIIVGQTRIHIDEVEELGNFIELEVVLHDNQTVEDGQKIAENFMKKLNINEDDLIDSAYIDILEHE